MTIQGERVIRAIGSPDGLVVLTLGVDAKFHVERLPWGSHNPVDRRDFETEQEAEISLLGKK